MDNIVESTGHYNFKRIDRPKLWYNNRTHYVVDIKEFERSISERCGSSMRSEVKLIEEGIINVQD